jgi:anaerobic magnesium-protoporphyrin IX monomethyl ester cyclase
MVTKYRINVTRKGFYDHAIPRCSNSSRLRNRSVSDILLIQPPVRDFYITAKRTIPYGLTGIAGALEAAGFSTLIFDALATSKSKPVDLPPQMAYLTKYYGRTDLSPFSLFHGFKHFGYSYGHIGEQARQSKAFLVGISSLFTPYLNEALETAEIVKRFHPGCHIVVGGHHPTAMPESIMACPAVDFVIRGEGEVAMPMLAEALQKGRPVEGLPGLVSRKKTGSLLMGNPVEMRHPDAYPLPASHLINHRFYNRKKNGSAVIVASRGCPMKCSYCSLGATSTVSYRRRGVHAVLEEIKCAISLHQARFIDFEDENLSLDRNWFITLLKEIINRYGHLDLELRAMNGLFPPSLDREMVHLMKRAGFKSLNLSLGSSSARQLRRFNRPDVIGAFEKALEWAAAVDLEAVGYIIAAAPQQRAGTSVSDLLFLASKRVLAGVSIFYPAPGSSDYRLCNDLKCLPEDFRLMRSSAFPITEGTTRKEAVTLLRLGRILNFMKSIVDNHEKIPRPEPFTKGSRIVTDSRRRLGKHLLAWFLHDGRIRGVTKEGLIYDHLVARDLTTAFVKGLTSIDVRGAKIP